MRSPGDSPSCESSGAAIQSFCVNTRLRWCTCSSVTSAVISLVVEAIARRACGLIPKSSWPVCGAYSAAARAGIAGGRPTAPAPAHAEVAAAVGTAEPVAAGAPGAATAAAAAKERAPAAAAAQTATAVDRTDAAALNGEASAADRPGG